MGAIANGVSPEAIARQLNREGIPDPGGRPWRNTTIRGQYRRGTGLINNEAYVGRLAWNRCRYIKDPKTGKRVARPNPPEKWIIVEVPSSRIIDDDLWSCVKTRQAEIRALVEQRRAAKRQMAESRVLAGLKDKLLEPNRIDLFIREVQTEAMRTRRLPPTGAAWNASSTRKSKPSSDTSASPRGRSRRPPSSST